jgi:hypothetical protein
VLNLSGVGLTSDDVAALESLASALAANTSIEQIDLDCNFFGGCCLQEWCCQHVQLSFADA